MVTHGGDLIEFCVILFLDMLKVVYSSEIFRQRINDSAWRGFLVNADWSALPESHRVDQ